MREARAGVQIAVGVKQFVKAKPDSPIESMTGVWACGLPRQPIVSVRCWSVMMTRTLRTLSGISRVVSAIGFSLSSVEVVPLRRYWETTLSMSSSWAPLVSVRYFAVKMTARTPKAQ